MARDDGCLVVEASTVKEAKSKAAKIAGRVPCDPADAPRDRLSLFARLYGNKKPVDPEIQAKARRWLGERA